MVDNSVKISLQAELDERQARNEVNRAVQNIERSIKPINLDNIIEGAVGGIAESLTGEVLNLVDSLGELAISSVTAAADFQKLNRSLQAAGIEDVAGTLETLRASSDRLGLSFGATAQQFAQFAAVTRGTAVEAQNLDIFQQLTAGFAGLGAGSDEAGRAFTALTQTLAKGVFAAEEVRGQLGEAVPAALPILARAAGLSIGEFNKRLSENGATIGDVNEIIPRFAEELAKVTAQTQLFAQNDLGPQLQAASNAFEEFRVSLGQTLTPLAAVGAGIAQLAFPAAAQGVEVLSQNISGLVAVLGLLAASQGIAALAAGGTLATGLATIGALIPPIALGIAAVAAASAGLRAAFAVFGAVSPDIKTVREESAKLKQELTGVAQATGPVAAGFREIFGVTGDYATDIANAEAANTRFIESLRDQLSVQLRNNRIFDAFATTLGIVKNQAAGLFQGADVAEAVNDFNALNDTIANLEDITNAFNQALRTENLSEFTTAVQATKTELAEAETRLAQLSEQGDVTSQEFIDLTKRSADLKAELNNLPSDVLGVDIQQAQRALATTEASIGLLEKRQTLSQQEQQQLDRLISQRDTLNRQLAVFNEVQSQVTVETRNTAEAQTEATDAAAEAARIKTEQLEKERQIAEAARQAAEAQREQEAAIRASFAIRQQQVQLEVSAINQQQRAAETLARSEVENLRVATELASAQAQLRGEKVTANQEAQIAAQLAERELAISLELTRAEAERANLTAQLAVNEAQLALEKEKQLGSDEKIIQLAEQRVDLARQQAATIAAAGALDVDTAEKRVALQQAQAELAEREARAKKEAASQVTANNIEPTQGAFTGTRAGGGVGTPIGGAGAAGTTQEETEQATKDGVAAAQEPVVRGIDQLVNIQQETLQGIRDLPGNLREAEQFQGTDFDAFLARFPQLAQRGGFSVPQAGLAAPEEVIDLPNTGRRSAVVGPGAPILPQSGPQTPIENPITLNLTVNGNADRNSAALIESAGRQAALELAQQLRQANQ